MNDILIPTAESRNLYTPVRKAGFVYVASTELLEPHGIYKIGKATVISERMAQLSGTASPAPFYPLVSISCADPLALEKALHDHFDHLRYRQNREFFELEGGLEEFLPGYHECVDLLDICEDVTLQGHTDEAKHTVAMADPFITMLFDRAWEMESRLKVLELKEFLADTPKAELAQWNSEDLVWEELTMDQVTSELVTSGKFWYDHEVWTMPGMEDEE